MKNTFLIFKMSFLLFALVFTGCKKKEVSGCTDSVALNYNSAATKNDGSCTYEPQGPKNASFESAYSSSDWVANGSFATSDIKRLNGTGFLPSQGVWYMGIHGSPTTGSITNMAYQDNISFSRSSTLTFDYSVATSSLSATGTAQVDILFTSNGTVTLWSKTFTQLNMSTQTLGEVINLPALPDKGRLTIKVSSNGLGSWTYLNFDIDNIRTN